ncbi:hypothetical protein RFI_20742 [Reticulomyxa filosa]|uniref:BRO1 domain-containing protein n=1 Tax=Reticulomyxa filosa TaxID=46433 RepID=X6MRF5_RETFI|nr:hypothetical protein RFI_20742 [Reticulomyxa filosa]|eukprot:ETO16598.1 hypothetical protein RFI_20742 [Reticulomyxa filosa]
MCMCYFLYIVLYCNCDKTKRERERGERGENFIGITFVCITLTSCSLALVNAQEFMVQLAVQTDKSSAVTAKLAQGIADKLDSLHKQLDSSLGNAHVDSISSDFRHYLRIRASLYKAIALKYQGKFAREKKLWGDCVTYFKIAKVTLKEIEFPKKKTEMNQYLEGLNVSLQRQLVSINTLLDRHAFVISHFISVYSTSYVAQKDNDAIYHELERPIEQLDRAEGLFKMQPEEYKGYDT